MNDATLRARYEEDGVLVHAEPLFPNACVQRAQAGMDAVMRGAYDTGRPPCKSPWNPGDDPNRLVKIEQPQFASSALRDVLAFPAFGRLAAAVTGAEWVQVWWVQLLVKPSTPPGATAPTNVGWHQDRSYWGAWEPDSELFTAWIGLSDVGDDCGPMQLVRGSHRWGFRAGSDFYAQDLEGQRATLAVPPGAAWDEIRATMPAGGLSLHHCLTYHGSGPNTSGRPRRSLAVHLRTQRSRPVGDRRAGLTAFIDDPDLCPIIYRAG